MILERLAHYTPYFKLTQETLLEEVIEDTFEEVPAQEVVEETNTIAYQN